MISSFTISLAHALMLLSLCTHSKAFFAFAWATYILENVDEEHAEEELWKLLFKLCYIDETNDVVDTWAKKNAQKAERGKAIDDLHLVKLHYTASNGTDLTVRLTPWSKFGHGDRKMPANYVRFNANIPTEEVCTTPDKFGTEGIVYASRPLVLGGKKIENFGFRFEGGKVVEVIADEGKEMLEALIRMDENASCHLALGRGLSTPPAGTNAPFNDSVIHVDFMIGTSDMHIEGTNEQGEEIVIFDNGDFAI